MKEYVRREKEKPCTDCKRNFPYFVMDFDHREGSEKVADINFLVHSLSWTRLKAEIQKCDVVCANCHRIRTQARMGVPNEFLKDAPTRVSC
jgi:hypothetical protein